MNNPAQSTPQNTETVVFEEGLIKVTDSKRHRHTYGNQPPSFIHYRTLTVEGVGEISQSRNWGSGGPIPFKGTPLSFARQRLKAWIKRQDYHIAKLEKMKRERDIAQAQLERILK